VPEKSTWSDATTRKSTSSVHEQSCLLKALERKRVHDERLEMSNVIEHHGVRLPVHSAAGWRKMSLPSTPGASPCESP
jgi:hypothetical protein